MAPPPFDSHSGTQTPSQSLNAAKSLMEEGDYIAAIPRLIHMMETDPDSAPTREARYWLGMAYYHTNSFRDAITLLEEYLRLAPEGRYQVETKRFLEDLYAEYDDRFLTHDELDAMIAEAIEQVKANPTAATPRMQLAELLWQRGDYNEAGALYAALIEDKPTLYGEEPIRHRLESLPDGGYIVLTPAEIERRAIEDRPLVFSGVSAFRSGRDLFTAQPRFYVVTGQLRNRSDSTLYSVRAHVTIYGFGNVVYDTRTVTFGRINAGETRAFSVRFSNFENIENILRYECTADFDRS